MANVSWIVGSDFNKIVKYEEKHEGHQRLEHQMQQFQDALDYCHLQDLGFYGNIFTWYNGREDNASISEQLNHFVANKEWQAAYPHWQVSHITVAYSDHASILLSTDVVLEPTQRKSPFWFEAM